MLFVRLKPFDKTKGHLKKTWCSPTGRTYMAGTDGTPSPLREVTDPAEEKYLRSIEDDQFEILDLPDEKAALDLTQKEMEDRARVGGMAVRSAVLPPEPPKEVPPPKPLSEPRFAPIGSEAPTAKAEQQKETPATEPAKAHKPQRGAKGRGAGK